MSLKKSQSIGTKLLFLMIIGILIPTVALMVNYVFSINQMSMSSQKTAADHLMSEVKNRVRFSVQSVVTSLETYYNEQTGKIPEDILIKSVLCNLRSIKYGDDGYFYAYQMDGLRLVAPENPAQEGKNLWNLTDPQGTKVIQNSIKAAQSGGNFFYYIWSNPKTKKQEKKVAYSMPLKMGNLVLAVGTGCYLPMVEKAKAEIGASIHKKKVEMMTTSTIGLILIILVTIVLAFKYLIKYFVTPVKNMSQAAERIARGDTSVNLSVDSEDEIGVLSKAFNTMITHIQEQVVAAESIAAGDLTVKIKERSAQDILSKSLNKVTSTLKSMVEEAKMLTGAVAEGKLDVRGDAQKFSGGYAEILSGLNTTLDIVVKPINEAGQVLGKMALNDLTLEMTGDYNGMLHQFKVAINEVRERLISLQEAFVEVSEGNISRLEEIQKVGKRSENDRMIPAVIKMMEAIKNLIDEVKMMSEAAIDGNLNERGDVSKYRGGYQTVIEGINETLESVIKPIKESLLVLEHLSKGDFQKNVTGDYRGDYAALKKAINTTIDSMSGILGEINTAAEQVAVGAKQVSDSGQSLSQGSAEQASTVEQITASMSEIADQTRENATKAGQVSKLALEAKNQAVEGNSQMQAMLKAMSDINESSTNISKIIKVIDEIAFQTNILALNAAVEAARAGQYGKGFAVVAEEVRNLAARSANAAKETTELIEGSINKVNAGTKIANDTAEALNQIVMGVTKTTELVEGIAISSNEQATGIAQINQGISQVAQVTQGNTATSEESAAASEELSSQAMMLKAMVGKFKLNSGSGQADKTAFSEDVNPAPYSTNNIKGKIHLDDMDFSKY